MKFRIYKDNAGEFRWSLIAANNKIIATSGEGYHNRLDAIKMIEAITNLDADNVTIELGPQTFAARLPDPKGD